VTTVISFFNFKYRFTLALCSFADFTSLNQLQKLYYVKEELVDCSKLVSSDT
jgi:hypothetical protein